MTNIYNSERFQIISYSNGIAYDFVNRSQQRSVYFQGDEATMFINMRDQLTLALVGQTDDSILQAIWFDYEDVSTPITLKD